MIVRAGAGHAAALAAIHAAAFPPAEAWSESLLGHQLAQPGGFGLIDERGGMVLARVAADEAEILTLAVAPAARCQGIATALLGAAIRHAEGAGAVAMFLEVAAANAPARALYAKAGFHPVGRRERYYADGGDAVVLRAALGGGLSRPA